MHAAPVQNAGTSCEYGHICHKSANFSKYGFFVEPKLDLAFLVRPKPRQKVYQLQSMASTANTTESTPVDPKKVEK